MMKCVLLAFLVAPLAASSQPMIEFDTASFHIPPVCPDTIVSFSLRYKNTGDDTLIITRASHSDGGLSGSYLKRTRIPPGERDSIMLKFNVPGYISPRKWSRAMTVESNAKNYPTYGFTFGGEIVPIDTTLWLQDLPNTTNQKPKIEKVNDSIFVFITYKDLNGSPFPANGLIVKRHDGVVLFDAGFDSLQMEQVIWWISSKLKAPIKVCIITHAHDDRYGGMTALKKHDIFTITTIDTEELLREKKLSSYRSILDDRYNEYWKDKKYWWGHLFYPGPGHSKDNIVIYLPECSLLYGGCFIKSVETEGLGNLADANVNAWKYSLEKVLKRFPDRKIVIPGHHDWRDPKSVEHTLELVNEYNSKIKKK